MFDGLRRPARGAWRILHLRQEAAIAPLRASWEVRADQPVVRRVALVALLAVLGTRPGARLAVDYSIGARLRRDWRVVATGREQVVCAPRAGDDGFVLKVVIGVMTRTPEELDATLAGIVEDEHELREAFGEFLAPVDYTIEPIDVRGRVFAVVGRQQRLSIVGSLFDQDANLGPMAQDLPADVRADLVDRITSYHADTGKMIDIIGMQNVVFAEGRSTPVLIDSLPMRPDMLARTPPDSDHTIGDEVRTRLELLAPS